MRKNIVDVITLGCSKNLVDSEKLIGQFMANGYTVHHNSEKLCGEIAVINTCGFIADAQEESINQILQLVSLKKSGQIGKVFVMGCLTERFMNELKTEIPEVDGFYGKFNWSQLLTDLGKAYYNDVLTAERAVTTPKHYAYLKISEGCDRKCSYCAIPIMTGKHKSRPMQDILNEARVLQQQGVKEIQLIAQDLTYYGMDSDRKHLLPELVDKISEVSGIEWIRLHYAYPQGFPIDLLEVMYRRENVCNYLDIALQHISNRMLKLMRRNITKQETYHLIEEMRSRVPDIHIRTTLMVGHPGETEEDFEELCQFVKDIRFDRMGAFLYSHEEGTFAHNKYDDHITIDVKRSRLDKLMSLQQDIAKQLNESKVGKVFKTMIDRKEGDYYIGRTEYDSPEVDQEVLIHQELSNNLKVGNFYPIEIIDVDNFDLFGKKI